MRIGIIKEGKVPQDKRVALTPSQCSFLIHNLGWDIKVQSSDIRCYTDQEYLDAGVEVLDDVSHMDILLGVKEVPIDLLVSDKTYFFFSHTIKKQPYNRGLLQAILAKNIRLIDYETLVDQGGERVIAFGRYAGVVGAYNGLLGYGKRSGAFELKPAYQCFDMAELFEECKKVTLPSLKLAITGNGRVANGAVETLKAAGLKQVTVEDFKNKTFTEAVFVQLNSADYHVRKDGQRYEKFHFFENPEAYDSSFHEVLPHIDILIASAYWNPASPVLFTKEAAQSDTFNIQLIADITCDIEGSIPSTVRSSTIEDPFYDYNAKEGVEKTAFSSNENITVMAVDNLPNELPRDASQSFGKQFIEKVVPQFEKDYHHEMLDKATICKQGKLNEYYLYLQKFVEGVE